MRFLKNRVAFRLLALLLCLVLLLTGCHRSFGSLQSLPLSTVDYTYDGAHWTELGRTDPDTDGFLSDLQRASALLRQSDNWTEIWESYNDLSDRLADCLTQYNLSEIDYYADCSDATLQQRANQLHTDYIQCSDAFSVWLSDILKSDYRQDYIRTVGKENALLYEDYTALTAEQKQWLDREEELINQYKEKSTAAQSDSMGALAEQVEPIYLELVQIRNRLAQSYGYKSYIDYAYEAEYYRSYIPAQVVGLEQEVKQTLAPVYTQFLLYSDVSGSDAPYRQKAGDPQKLLATLQSCFSQLDSHLVQSLDTMVESGFYDIDYRDTKFDVSFTLMLNQLGLPYLFVQPEQDSRFYTVSSLVHELGHYNGFLANPSYQQPDYFLYQLPDIDTAEIASNGLEVLFTRFYPELYGKKNSDILQQLVISEQLSAIVYGCVLDEFQQLIYTQEELQPGQVSELFHNVMTDYFGEIFAEDYSYYWWARVNHNFEVPFYYISYAMSSLAVLQLWQTAQTDPDAALQTYLQLVSCGEDADFILLLKEFGMQDVFSCRYLQSLSSQLSVALL